MFANSKMSGMHFEATRGTWTQVTCGVCHVTSVLIHAKNHQERAAPTFTNSSMQGALPIPAFQTFVLLLVCSTQHIRSFDNNTCVRLG